MTGQDDLTGYIAVPQIWDDVAESFLIAPNGDWFAATSAGSHEIKIVDMMSGTILRRLSAAGGTIRGGAITNDSKVVVAELHNGRLVAWRAETGQPAETPPKDLPLQSFETNAPKKAKSPYAIHWSSGSKGNRIIDVSGGKPPMKPVRVELENVQSAIDTPCGTAPGAAVFDGKHLLISQRGGEDALIFAQSATAFELKDGTSRKLWEAPCGASGGAIAGDSRFFSIASPAPIGPLTIWNIRTNRVVAHFEDSEGVFAMAKDGRVFVTPVFKDETKLFQIHRGQRTATLPRQTDNIATLRLSSNGQWLAAKVRPDRNDLPDSAIVISMADGRQTKTMASPSPAQEIATLRVSNEGNVALTLRKGDDGAGEIEGRHVLARSGDGHWAEVVDDKDESMSLIFDTQRHQFVARIPGHLERFTLDSRFLITRDGGLFDLATKRLVWSIHGTPDDRGYVMLFSNGCVQTSPGAELFIKLVRGFEVRPYDTSAAKVFAKPGCKGRPEAIAASAATFAADQAALAAVTREGEEARIRARQKAPRL